MDEFSCRKTAGGVLFSRKGSDLVVMDSSTDRGRSTPICSRVGCSSRMSSVQDNRTGVDKPKATKRPLYSPRNGKEASASSSRTPASPVPRKPSDASKKLLNARDRLSSRVQTNVSSSSVSVPCSRHGKEAIRRGELGIIRGSRAGTSSSKYNFKNLNCNVLNDVDPSSASTSESGSSSALSSSDLVLGRKRIGEVDERKNKDSHHGVSISESRRRTLSSTRNDGVRSFRSSTRAGLNESRIPRTEGSSLMPPRLPQPSITLDTNASISEYLNPFRSTNLNGRLGNSSGNMSRGNNLNGIAEMLVAMDTIDQDDDLTYEQLLVLETNLFLRGLASHDQHRGMRLDIDSMSYEELLELEERMGTVSTALSEEALTKCLKKTIYEAAFDGTGDDAKCSICQDEYEELKSLHSEQPQLLPTLTPTTTTRVHHRTVVSNRELTQMTEEEAPASTPATASDMESKVRTAMVSRVLYFKEQADSLTFEGVRRLLEKDLGLDTYALDVHKRFVKQCLQECLESGNEDEGPKNSGDAAETISSVEGQIVDKNEQKKEAKEPNSKDGLEESPETDLMEGHEKSKTETVSTEEVGNHTAPSEAMIEKAILKRASHFRKNSENITMVGVRRLIEEDLKLDKFALDSYKKLISEQVNEVLTNPQVAKSATNDKKAVVKKKIAKKSIQAELSASSDSGSEIEEDGVKPRRKSTPKGKTQSLSGSKKRKQHDEDVREPKRKQSKASKVKSEENSEDEDGGDGSEQENTELSAEKPVKRKEVPKSSYGKRVENLKSIIKCCSMSIPPSIYKKVKQAPESKREAALIKELEDILAKEGLSANPSEKEIREVKKKKERAKELEGIDMSNIVSSSRRRSAFSFAPPPKPKIPAESDADSGDSEDEEEEEDDDGDDDNEEEVVEEQDEEKNGNESKSDDEGDNDADSD